MQHKCEGQKSIGGILCFLKLLLSGTRDSLIKLDYLPANYQDISNSETQHSKDKGSHQPWFFHECWRSNSSSYTCIAGALSTEPSPWNWIQGLRDKHFTNWIIIHPPAQLPIWTLNITSKPIWTNPMIHFYMGMFLTIQGPLRKDIFNPMFWVWPREELSSNILTSKDSTSLWSWMRRT